MKKSNRGWVIGILSIAMLFLLSGGFLSILDTPEIEEYAFPFQTNQTEKLFASVESLRLAFPESLMAASGYKQQGAVITQNGREAACAVQGIGSGWFDLYHQTLLAGRLLGEKELEDGQPVAVVSTSLSYALWGEETVTNQPILMDGQQILVVGVVKQDQPIVYLPLALMADGDIQLVSGSNIRAAVFDAAVQQHFPNGSHYSWKKEKMAASLPVRYLLVFLLGMLLISMWKYVKQTNRRMLSWWREKQQHVYAGRMMLPTFGLTIAVLCTCGLWIACIYGLLCLAVEPVPLFPEWLPSDPSDLGRWVEVLWRNMQGEHALHVTLTEGVYRLRTGGKMLQMASLLGLIAWGMGRGWKKK